MSVISMVVAGVVIVAAAALASYFVARAVVDTSTKEYYEYMKKIGPLYEFDPDETQGEQSRPVTPPEL